MSRIDDLITELCPNGAPFYQLADIARTLPGLSGKTKTDFSDGNARYVSYKNAFSNIAVNQSAEDFVKVGDEKQNKLQLGDVVITGSSESLDEVGMSSVVDENPGEPLYLNSFCFIVRFNDSVELEPGFSKYLFRSDSVRAQIRKTASGVTRINISKPRFLKLRLPVPPLEVQREIVRILDQFTALEAELEAELEARRKQYEHYRSDLLTFDDDVQTFALGKIVDVKTGSAVSKKAIQEDPGPYPVINSGRDPLGFIGKFNTDGAPIGVTSRGAGVGSITWCGGRYFRGNLNYGVTIRDEDQVNVRFLYHTLQYLQPQIKELCSFQGIPALNKVNLEKLIVPLPSRIAQARTAEMLDKFDALVNDLSVGLPAELAARRKQYEYYRDKLLTFEEARA